MLMLIGCAPIHGPEDLGAKQDNFKIRNGNFSLMNSLPREKGSLRQENPLILGACSHIESKLNLSGPGISLSLFLPVDSGYFSACLRYSVLHL